MRRTLIRLACLGAASLASTQAALAFEGTVLASEVTKLTAQSPADFDRFSESVAISGATAVVGMSGAGTGGAVSVFVRSGTTWIQDVELVPLDNQPGDAFGRSVALEGDRLVVGAYGDDGAAASSGSVYVFERSGSSWSQVAKLVASDASLNAFFGLAVDLSGDTIAATAGGATGLGGAGAGAVYVFTGGGASWTEQAKLSASDGAPNDGFGVEVALDGDVLVLGAAEENSLTGAAYVFERSGTTWGETVKLTVSDAAFFNRFGESVTVSGDRIACGAPGYVHGVGNTQGSAYVFQPSGTTWVEQARLEASDGTFDDRLGEAVELDGDVLLIGAAEDSHAVLSAGSVYVFVQENGTWSERAQLLASDPGPQDLFGGTLALDGRYAVIGSLNADEGASDNGAAYVFELVVAGSFCDAGDGALASCPCGNVGAPGAGCDLQQGTGGIELDVLAQESALLNRATLSGSGYPPTGSPTTLVIRGTELDPAAPVVFGDGLRCVGTPLVRLAATFASGGVSTHTFGHGTMAGAGTFYYQLWARNTPAMFCTPEAFNLSNGRALTW